jgi:hypothetical protein
MDLNHSHLRTARRLAALLGFGLVLASGVYGEGPAWWTNRSVLASGSTTNDYAAVNMGQLKWIATNAYAELNANPLVGAGTNLPAVLTGWLPDGTNYCMANVGQLKYVGSLVWDRLILAGYTNAYPWSTGTNDYAAANIGQVKYVFSFDLTKDSDVDGLANWVETGTGIYIGPSNTGSSPTNSDSDGDGISDGAEVTARTDPNNPDLGRPTIVIASPTNGCRRVSIP